MLRSMLTLAAVGVAGFVVWKLALFMLLPMFFGFLAFAIKLALIGLFAYVLYRLLRRATEPRIERS